jgi:pyruvate formate lyase activating enzyme
MEAFAKRLAVISPEIPLHILRFYPRHKMADAEPTPVGTMKKLAAAAQKHLKNVYLGNI